jgi:hypothetical protein
MAWQTIRGYEDRSLYPSSEYQLRHLFNGCATSGLADAFRKVNGRVFFDPDRLQELIAATPDLPVAPTARPKAPAPRRRTRSLATV